MTITPNSTLADICTAYRLERMTTGYISGRDDDCYWARAFAPFLDPTGIYGTGPTQDQAIEDALFLLAQRRERV